MIPRKKLKNRIDWIRRRRVLVKTDVFICVGLYCRNRFRYVWQGLWVLTFAILLAILIAECVVSKGSFSGVRCIVVLLILTSSAVLPQHNSDTLR